MVAVIAVWHERQCSIIVKGTAGEMRGGCLSLVSPPLIMDNLDQVRDLAYIRVEHNCDFSFFFFNHNPAIIGHLRTTCYE